MQRLTLIANLRSTLFHSYSSNKILSYLRCFLYRDQYTIYNLLPTKCVEKIIEIELRAEEKAALDKSAEAVEVLKADLKRLGFL